MGCLGALAVFAYARLPEGTGAQVSGRVAAD